jgi:hypothetical protein
MRPGLPKAMLAIIDKGASKDARCAALAMTTAAIQQQ